MKNTVLQARRLIHEGIVLQLDVIPKDDAGTDVGTSSDDAVTPDPRIFANLGQMPYPRTGI